MRYDMWTLQAPLGAEPLHRFGPNGKPDRQTDGKEHVDMFGFRYTNSQTASHAARQPAYLWAASSLDSHASGQLASELAAGNIACRFLVDSFMSPHANQRVHTWLY